MCVLDKAFFMVSMHFFFCYNKTNSKEHIKFAPLYPPFTTLQNREMMAESFAMISLLGPGVILFIFILWLMMPPADYIKIVGSRTSAGQRGDPSAGLASLASQEEC